MAGTPPVHGASDDSVIKTRYSMHDLQQRAAARKAPTSVYGTMKRGGAPGSGVLLVKPLPLMVPKAVPATPPAPPLEPAPPPPAEALVEELKMTPEQILCCQRTIRSFIERSRSHTTTHVNHTKGRKKRNRTRVVMEIFSTERTYVGLLEELSMVLFWLQHCESYSSRFICARYKMRALAALLFFRRRILQQSSEILKKLKK